MSRKDDLQFLTTDLEYSDEAATISTFSRRGRRHVRGGRLKGSRHPGVALFHVLFKGLALAVYLFAGLFTSNRAGLCGVHTPSLISGRSRTCPDDSGWVVELCEGGRRDGVVLSVEDKSDILPRRAPLWWGCTRRRRPGPFCYDGGHLAETAVADCRQAFAWWVTSSGTAARKAQARLGAVVGRRGVHARGHDVSGPASMLGGSWAARRAGGCARTPPGRRSVSRWGTHTRTGCAAMPRRCSRGAVDAALLRVPRRGPARGQRRRRGVLAVGGGRRRRRRRLPGAWRSSTPAAGAGAARGAVRASAGAEPPRERVVARRRRASRRGRATTAPARPRPGDRPGPRTPRAPREAAESALACTATGSAVLDDAKASRAPPTRRGRRATCRSALIPSSSLSRLEEAAAARGPVARPARPPAPAPAPVGAGRARARARGRPTSSAWSRGRASRARPSPRRRASPTDSAPRRRCRCRRRSFVAGDQRVVAVFCFLRPPSGGPFARLR